MCSPARFPDCPDVMRDFWENYPKGWRVRGSGIAIEICPDVSTVTYPSGGIEEVRSFFLLPLRFPHSPYVLSSLAKGLR